MKTKEEIEVRLKELEDYLKNVCQFSEIKAEAFILKWVLGITS